jgi:hypothetical protein
MALSTAIQLCSPPPSPACFDAVSKTVKRTMAT